MATQDSKQTAPADPKQLPTQTPPAAPAQVIPPAGGPPGGTQVSQDRLIAQVQQQVRASVPPQFRVPVQKIYLAGMKLMYSPDTHQLMIQQLQGNSFTAQAVARGVAALMTIMYRESKGQMPLPAAAPAAILLVCEALDYLEQTKQGQVTPELLSDAVQQVVAILLQKMGMTPASMASDVNKNAQAAGMQVPGQASTPTAASTTPGTGQAGLVQQQMGG
jgi:hypothetical protein